MSLLIEGQRINRPLLWRRRTDPSREADGGRWGCSRQTTTQPMVQESEGRPGPSRRNWHVMCSGTARRQIHSRPRSNRCSRLGSRRAERVGPSSELCSEPRLQHHPPSGGSWAAGTGSPDGVGGAAAEFGAGCVGR